jgi:hypothetical protein
MDRPHRPDRLQPRKTLRIHGTVRDGRGTVRDGRKVWTVPAKTLDFLLIGTVGTVGTVRRLIILPTPMTSATTT